MAVRISQFPERWHENPQHILGPMRLERGSVELMAYEVK